MWWIIGAVIGIIGSARQNIRHSTTGRFEFNATGIVALIISAALSALFFGGIAWLFGY